MLVMRLWPRGVRKTQVDVWERDLAPSLELVKGLLSGEMAWEEYRPRYLEEVKERGKEKLAELKKRSKGGETITLLCWCADEDRCHRSLLAGLLK